METRRRGTGTGLTVYNALDRLGTDDAAVDVEAVIALRERVEHGEALRRRVRRICRVRRVRRDRRVRHVRRDRCVHGDDSAGLAVVALDRAELTVGVVAAEGEEEGLVGGGDGAELVLGFGLGFCTGLVRRRRGGEKEREKGKKRSSNKQSPSFGQSSSHYLGPGAICLKRKEREEGKNEKGEDNSQHTAPRPQNPQSNIPSHPHPASKPDTEPNHPEPPSTDEGARPRASLERSGWSRPERPSKGEGARWCVRRGGKRGARLLCVVGKVSEGGVRR